MFFKKSDVVATVKSHPNGEFDGTIVDINIMNNKKQTGKLLIIKYETMAGSIAQFISFEHSNKRFEAGEKEKLAALVDACGLTELHDASDLIGNTVHLQISSQPPGPDGRSYPNIVTRKISTDFSNKSLW